MLDAVDWVSKQVDNGHVASLTSLDLSKAFDSVDHGVLLDKLEWCGVQSTWFHSYLENRKQTVSGGSSLLPLSHGVAQGSIVGPILFLIFINDLSSFLTHGRLLSYADDTQLLDHSPPDAVGLSCLKVRVEETIAQLQHWFQSNSLKMNPNKTFFTLIGTTQSLKKVANFHINLSGSKIVPCQTVKILGVLLDQDLSWESHISMVVRRCNAILSSLYKIRHHLTPEVLTLLVNAHVFPYIHYCLSVWGGATKGRLHRIQKIINFAARLIKGLRRSAHISPALKELGWPEVEEMVRQHDCSRVQRALTNEQCPPAITAMFVARAHISQRETRAVAAGALELTRFNLTRTQRGFAYRATSAWNTRAARNP